MGTLLTSYSCMLRVLIKVPLLSLIATLTPDLFQSRIAVRIRPRMRENSDRTKAGFG